MCSSAHTAGTAVFSAAAGGGGAASGGAHAAQPAAGSSFQENVLVHAKKVELEANCLGEHDDLPFPRPSPLVALNVRRKM